MRQDHPARAIPVIACLAAVAALFACSERLPMIPEEDGTEVQIAVAPAAERISAALTGCSTFRIQLSGRDSIAVTRLASDCGSVQPVVTGEPVFDRVDGRVRLPIALMNTSEQDVTEPAAVYGWEDSLRVIQPIGIARNKHSQRYLTFAGADSVIPDTSAAYPGAHFWRYDGVLNPAEDDGRDPVLAAGDTSGLRWIEIAIHDGARIFEVAFHAHADRATPPVPPIAPDTVPLWIYTDSNIIRSAPCITGPVIHNVVIVLFSKGTPQSKRQAAVDAVDGKVIGGARIDEDGFYLVLIDDDGTGKQLCQAMHKLQSFPYVEHAGPELFISEAYVEPADGQGFQDWRIRPDSANGINWALEAIAAPLAWGCETGSAEAPVAAIGSGFRGIRQIEELRPNLAPIREQFLNAGDHGIGVTSIMAARGNNDKGITGVMWTADVRIYEIGRAHV